MQIAFTSIYLFLFAHLKACWEWSDQMEWIAKTLFSTAIKNTSRASSIKNVVCKHFMEINAIGIANTPYLGRLL